MAIVQVSVSNTHDSPDAAVLKESLREYSDLISDTSIFNQNNNKNDISDLLYRFLEDLYITEPEEVINFVNQKPSKKLVENLFSQFGISDKISSVYPDMLKTKTAYLLNQLFENKGSNVEFDLFNNIISEFYHNLNFYNVRVEQRVISTRYSSPTIVSKYMLDNDGDIDMKYELEENNAGFLKDPEIEFQVFPKIEERHHKIHYLIKFFEPLEQTIKIKLDFTSQYTIPKGTEQFTITELKYDIYSVFQSAEDEAENSGRGERDEQQLVYTLEPVLINDPLSVIDKIDSSDLRTNKYLMQRYDFFNTDNRNTSPVDIFPIITNVLFIQFTTSDSMDTM
ncbi:MAG: hypothetical protein DRG78_08455, partial [Epsilonproteobacteria bacterium]